MQIKSFLSGLRRWLVVENVAAVLIFAGTCCLDALKAARRVCAVGAKIKVE
jgi:hypothetical protein